MKLQVSDDVLLKLENLKRILAGTPAGTFSLKAEGGCGEQCKVTCAFYCRGNCEAMCTANCQNSRLVAGAIGCGSMIIWHL